MGKYASMLDATKYQNLKKYTKNKKQVALVNLIVDNKLH